MGQQTRGLRREGIDRLLTISNEKYSDFELGAVPPFGGRQEHVLADERLARRESVVVEAGSHARSVRIKTQPNSCA
jgi:hypothetical protein